MERQPRMWAGLVFLILSVILLVFLSLRIGEQPVINVSIGKMPLLLDPAKISSYEEKLLAGAIYETLLTYNSQEQEAHSCLAEKWTVDRNGKSYTFYLHEGIKFHDGSLLTAKDVKFSWERILDPELSCYGYLMKNVVGAEEKLNGGKGEVEGIRVINSKTVQVNLKEPDFTFPAVVSSPLLAIVSAKKVRDSGSDYGTKGNSVAGTGPFVLKKWGDESLTLARNWRFAGGKPQVKKINFMVLNMEDSEQLIKKGTIDVAALVSGNIVQKFAEEKNLRVIKKPVLSSLWLGFNTASKPYGNNRFLRKAVSAALDRDALAANLLGEGGKSLRRILPPELSPAEPSNICQDQEQAALENLKKAGYPYGAGLQQLVFTYNESPGHDFLARSLQGQLGKVGIEVEFQKLAWDDFSSGLRQGEYPFFRWGWEADYPEAGNFLYPNFASDAGITNFLGFSNASYDNLLKEAREARDVSQRRELYRKAEEILLERAVVIPLFQKVNIFVVGEDIESFYVDSLGRIDFRKICKNNYLCHTYTLE